eukprot:GEMP01000196.1.p2 GENE.GEMP01000196.1~~GEMP01000196.1.p2  ORF type:complete len:1169 (+),score=232.66 GEMP01000196.1:4316-7822(+)
MEKGKAKVELLFRFKKNVCVIGTPAVIQTKQMKFTLQLTDRSGKPCYAPNPKTYLVHSNSTYLAHMLPPLSMKPANSPARWRKTREFIARKAANVLRENAPLSSAISGFSTSDNDERLYRPGLSDYDDEVDSCGAKALERYQGAKKDSVNSTKSTKRQKYGVKLPNLFYSTVGWAKVTLMLAPTEDNDASKCGDIFPLICTYTHIPNYFGSQASISGCIITVQPRYFIVNRTKYLLEFRLVDPKVTQHAVVARPLPSTPLAPWTTEPIWLKSWMKRPSIEVSTRGGFWSSAIVLSPSKTGRYSMVFGAMVLTVELIEHDGVMHVFIRRKICFSFSIDSSARMLRRAGLLTDSREQRVFWAMGPEEEGQRSTQKVTKGGDILENKEKQRGVAIGFFDPFRASEERLNTVEIILPSIKGIFQEYIDSFQSPISTATLPPTEGDYFPPVSGEKEHTDMTSDDSCSNADNPSEAVRFTIRTDVGTLFILVGPGLLAIDPSKCLCVVIRRLYGCTHILFATKHLDGIAPLASEHALDKASGDNWYICATCGSTLKSHQIPFCPECRSPLVWPLMYHEERDADSSNALTVGDHHALVRHEGISVMARMQEWWEFYMGAALSVQIKLNGADISLIDRPARREILHALIGAVTGTFDAPHGAGVISRTVCVTVDWLQVAARFSSVEARKKAGTSCTNRAIVYTRDNEDKPASSGAINRLINVTARIQQMSDCLIKAETLNVQFQKRIEVTLDDDILASLLAFGKHVVEQAWTDKGDFDKEAHPLYWVAAHSGGENRNIPLETILTVDNFVISRLTIVIWAKVNFRQIPGVPAFMYNLFRIFTLWDASITLKRATINIEPKKMKSLHKPILQFAKGLIAEYSWDITRAVIKLIGSSNLFNLFSFIYLPIHQTVDWVKSKKRYKLLSSQSTGTSGYAPSNRKLDNFRRRNDIYFMERNSAMSREGGDNGARDKTDATMQTYATAAEPPGQPALQSSIVSNSCPSTHRGRSSQLSGSGKTSDFSTQHREIYLRKHFVHFYFAGNMLSETRLVRKRDIPTMFFAAQQKLENTHPELFDLLVGFFELDDACLTLVIVTETSFNILMMRNGTVTIKETHKVDDATQISFPGKDGIRISFRNGHLLELSPIKYFNAGITRSTINIIEQLLLKKQDTGEGPSVL